MEILYNLNYDWLHNKIIYDTPEDLYQQATVKIAIAFWYGEVELERYVAARKVFEKIPSLTLPKSIKNDIAEIVELIGDQLNQFKRSMPNKFLDQQLKTNKFLDKNSWSLWKKNLYWTSQCTINKLRSAESLTDTVDLDVETRFEIATTFCLVNRINILSIQMPSSYLETNAAMYDMITAMDDVSDAKIHFGMHQIVPDFTLNFQNEYKDRFSTALKKGIYPACEYYWQRLTETNKLDAMNWHFVPEAAYTSTNCILFILTHMKKEMRLQLLQDENWLYYVMLQLSDPQWLPVFNMCKVDLLKPLAPNYLVELLHSNTERAKETIALKKKYIHLCSTLLQLLSKKYEITSLILYSKIKVMNALGILIDEGEINATVELLKTMDKEWLKEQFSLCTSELIFFIRASIRHRVLENIFSESFPTTKDRNKFFRELKVNEVIYYFIVNCEPMDDTDRILCLVYSNSEEIKSFKIKFAEEKGCNLCYALLRNKEWEAAGSLVKWCFTSEEEINSFYIKFFRNKFFAKLFLDTCFSSIDVIILFIKENNLEKLLTINELALDVCLMIILQFFDCFYNRTLRKIKEVFEALDMFLLTCIYNNQKLLIKLKKDFFINENKKLYISFPLKFYDKVIHRCSKKNINEMWCQSINDFFNWICSLDDELKSKIKKEFWNSEEVLWTQESLKSKDFEEVSQEL